MAAPVNSLVFSYLDCGYTTHGILDHGYSPSSRLPRHWQKWHELLADFLSGHNIRSAWQDPLNMWCWCL
uniref:Uncharacterized protein n=1 Tax=Setaria viridis TaxID=4556 RepID=A0A4U6VKJ8_SETVI|nr:hypothetical protein SEVIR_2G016000v2 [Setaria viridis]